MNNLDNNTSKKTVVTFQIPGTHSQIIIEVCNIFEQVGPKVIHCHHTFDTDQEVMRETSVMGQFIKLCKDKDFDLDSEIDKWITRHKQAGIEVESLPCRKTIFDIGTSLPIKVDGDLYILTAFNDLRKFLDTGAMELDSYIEYLDNLWNSVVRVLVDKTIINIPAFGNKIINISNNGFTIDQKIGLIVLSYFKVIKYQRLFENLHICIHESESKLINLESWENTILPYLFQFSQLPLGLKSLSGKQKGVFAGIKKSIKSYSKDKECIDDNSKQIFISHAKEDCEEADVVYEYLESLGYKCWMDIHDITPGIPYAKEIMKGFNGSAVVVAVISKNTMKSVGVQNEIDNVYKNNKKIIPFRIDDTDLSDELSFYLSSTQWINAFPKFEEHLEELGKSIKQLLN